MTSQLLNTSSLLKTAFLALGLVGLQLNVKADTVFGTLETDTAHAAQEYQAGERVAMVELKWRLYEPANNSFDAKYVADIRARVQKLKSIGFSVTLGLGTHYAPQWLKDMPGSRFVNQNGQQSQDLNYVFSQPMRNYLARYLARIDTDLGLSNFGAIRVTSGGNGEVLYPSGGTYWAFDENAQGGPERPDNIPPCPYPGWKPGQNNMTPTQVREWTDWYIHCLSRTVEWQIETLNARGFKGWYQVVTPGSGVRPSAYDAAIANNLPNGLMGVGAVWNQIYEGLSHQKRVVVYISSVADNSGRNDVTQPSDVNVALSDPQTNSWSATRWLVRIAHQYQMPVGGENPGFKIPVSLNSHYIDASPEGMMTRAFAQAKAGNFQVFYWAHSFRLWDGTKPFADYAAGIKAATNGKPPLLANP